MFWEELGGRAPRREGAATRSSTAARFSGIVRGDTTDFRAECGVRYPRESCAAETSRRWRATSLARNNIENEVDRYITWPGQALAYKLGQLEIMKLRDEAKQKMGPRFDIKEFHDVVLKNGALALPVLREQVEAYYAEKAPVDAPGMGPKR